LTAGGTVSQLVHINGYSPTIIQATAETGDSDDQNSREAAGGDAHQTMTSSHRFLQRPGWIMVGLLPFMCANWLTVTPAVNHLPVTEHVEFTCSAFSPVVENCGNCRKRWWEFVLIGLSRIASIVINFSK